LGRGVEVSERFNRGNPWERRMRQHTDAVSMQTGEKRKPGTRRRGEGGSVFMQGRKFKLFEEN